MDNTNRFNGKGQIYDSARPKYAIGLFEYLKKAVLVPDKSVFADVGSGTGIFTEQLLDCGYRVYAVEPNSDMRKRAEEKLSANENFISVNGSADKMNIPRASVNYLTVAQAFHWFEPEPFKNECRRVLKQGGKVIIIYNSRDENAPCTRALARLRAEYNPEFHGFSNGMSSEKCTAFFNGKCDIFTADNSQAYNRQQYINRVLSSSYSLKESDENYSEYLKEINQIFDRFSTDGYITVPTSTVAYIGSV